MDPDNKNGALLQKTINYLNSVNVNNIEISAVQIYQGKLYKCLTEKNPTESRGDSEESRLWAATAEGKSPFRSAVLPRGSSNVDVDHNLSRS